MYKVVEENSLPVYCLCGTSHNPGFPLEDAPPWLRENQERYAAAGHRCRNPGKERFCFMLESESFNVKKTEEHLRGTRGCLHPGRDLHRPVSREERGRVRLATNRRPAAG
jgi:hypothetical protein